MNEKNRALFEDSDFLALGSAYEKGIGVNQDANKAFQYFKKAASYGNATALGKLGLCYEQGTGVSKDLETAIDYYEQAVESNDLYGNMKLGDFYWDGNLYIVQNRQKAYQYYFRALELSKEYNDLWNAPDVYWRIARCFSVGVGTVQDTQGAIRFYEYAKDAYSFRIALGDMEAERQYEACEEALEELENQIPVDKKEHSSFYQA